MRKLLRQKTRSPWKAGYKLYLEVFDDGCSQITKEYGKPYSETDSVYLDTLETKSIYHQLKEFFKDAS